MGATLYCTHGCKRMPAREQAQRCAAAPTKRTPFLKHWHTLAAVTVIINNAAPALQLGVVVVAADGGGRAAVLAGPAAASVRRERRATTQIHAPGRELNSSTSTGLRRRPPVLILTEALDTVRHGYFRRSAADAEAACAAHAHGGQILLPLLLVQPVSAVQVAGSEI
jgi:hypothetical protein